MYDYIFITHLPSFYKVNLYNELSKSCRILIIYIGKHSKERDINFVKFDHLCDVFYLSEGNWENGNLVKNLVKLFYILLKNDSRVISVNGWDRIEFWFITLLRLKRKKALVLESGLQNSKINNIYSAVKRLFIRQFDVVFASGDEQIKLALHLNFTKNIIKTYGVGLINKPVVCTRSPDRKNNSFLYIGRLSPEKNIQSLLQIFQNLPDLFLTIVGIGPLKSLIDNYPSNNIRYIPSIPNEQLYRYMSTSAALIIPSHSEVWGLVVEEALLHGLPVICSNNVGAKELISEGINGIIYNSDSELIEILNRTINSSLLEGMQKNMKNANYELHTKNQYSCYVNYINK